MTQEFKQTGAYLYNYVCDENEVSICALEMRTLFGVDTSSQYNVVESAYKLEPGRSPFITGRIDVLFEGNTTKDIIRQVKSLETGRASFIVRVIQNRSFSEGMTFQSRRHVEQEVGRSIKGRVDFHAPDISFGMMFVKGRWLFGVYHESQAVWLHHKKKPHSYSTSLNTRLARAIVNIAIPDPADIKAIDPCCGIGTVVIEALSMGIDMTGSDNNPLVMAGARENIGYFGLYGEIRLQDICEIEERYDVAVIDLPYNLCSVLPEEEKYNMLKCARKFACKVVVVTSEPVEAVLKKTGFRIVDRGEWKKRTFTRQIIVCN